MSQSVRRKLVVVGNGMAGMHAVEELLALAPEMYDITVFGAEPYGNYNRILLSPVLAAEKTVDEIMLNSPEWYAEHGIALRAGQEVVKIDRVRRRVVVADGSAMLTPSSPVTPRPVTWSVPLEVSRRAPAIRELPTSKI